MEIITPPRVEERPVRPYVGIRLVTPFRGMLRVRDELLREVRAWIEARDAEPVEYGFLRLWVIDMTVRWTSRPGTSRARIRKARAESRRARCRQGATRP